MKKFVKELEFIGMYIVYVVTAIVVLEAYILVSITQAITHLVMRLYRTLQKEILDDSSEWDYLSRRLISEQIEGVARYEKIK